jgi:hypothetical protein
VRRTDLVLLHRGGTSSSEKGVAYPVVLRNTGAGTFWDVEVRVTHDGEETDRTAVKKIGAQSETDQLFLLVPAKLCDEGTPGVGLRPRGRVAFEALLNDEVIAAGEPVGQPPEPEVERVPRTREEEAVLLRTRPPLWEYLLFASVLHREMSALEPKYRDHEVRFAPPSEGRPIEGLEAMGFMSRAFRESRALVANVDRIFDPSVLERAFGAPGEPGDAERIEHVAKRVIDVYSGLLDWAARLRATPVDDEFEHAVELGTRFVDLPIEQFREFVARTVAEMDRLPALLREEREEPLNITLTLKLDIEEGLQDELAREIQRLEEMWERGELDA